jgi:hypothetical protein
MGIKLNDILDENGLFRPTMRAKVYDFLTHPGFAIFEAYINHIVENLKEEQIRRFANLEHKKILNLSHVLAFKAGEVVGLSIAKNILQLAYHENRNVDDLIKDYTTNTEIPPAREEVTPHEDEE